MCRPVQIKNLETVFEMIQFLVCTKPNRLLEITLSHLENENLKNVNLKSFQFFYFLTENLST
jgi:hypothetical protein